MVSKATAIISSGALLAVGSMVAMPSADAATRAASSTSGACTKGSNWSAAVSKYGTGWYVGFNVAGGKSGQKWKFTVKRDGVLVYSKTKAATPYSGFGLAQFSANVTSASRTAKFSLRAVNTTTGSTCVAALSASS